MSSSRTRWMRAQAREVVEALEASGLSMAQFERERGLDPERIHRWRARFRREAAEAGPRLVVLVTRREAPGARLQVDCPSGHRVLYKNSAHPRIRPRRQRRHREASEPGPMLDPCDQTRRYRTCFRLNGHFEARRQDCPDGNPRHSQSS